MLSVVTPLNFMCELGEKKVRPISSSFSKGNNNSDLLSREMPKLD